MADLTADDLRDAARCARAYFGPMSMRDQVNRLTTAADLMDSGHVLLPADDVRAVLLAGTPDGERWSYDDLNAAIRRLSGLLGLDAGVTS